MSPKYALKTYLYVAIQGVLGHDKRSVGGVHFGNFIEALEEIGFVKIGEASSVGVTLRPEPGMYGTDEDLFVTLPACANSWWDHEYNMVAEILRGNYGITATDFIEIPEDVDMAGVGFAIPDLA
ncbi:hypothetical protein C8Q73DRAFT_791216 [Cubamyces lactineus]|nr:hypothetical protein C8Q73DRAFT_791216 [Cubamyces lactineus]